MTRLALPKQKVVDELKTRVRSNKCLLCEEPLHRRGLCSAHYQQFLRKLNSMPRAARVKLQARLISEGKILAAGVVTQLMRDNPFE